MPNAKREFPLGAVFAYAQCMFAWLFPDWAAMFKLDTPVLEIVLRGSIMYLALFVLLRVFPKRQGGNISVTDVLLIVLIADASQNGMAGDHRSITCALILVATLLFWDLALDWVTYHSPRIRKLIEPKPLLLIRDGRIMKAHLAKEHLTEDQLKSKLREHGVDDVRQVKKACLESEGHISVIRKDGGDSQAEEPEQPH